MDHLHALSIVDHRDVHLAVDLSNDVHFDGSRTLWNRRQRLNRIHATHGCDQLYWLHRGGYYSLDVAEHRVMGRGLRPAQRTDAWHARIELALPHLALRLFAWSHGSTTHVDAGLFFYYCFC